MYRPKRKFTIALSILIALIVIFVAIPKSIAYHKGREERKAQEQREAEISDLVQKRTIASEQTDTTDPFGDDNVVRVLLIGLDARIGQTSAHCDAIQLFEINKETNQVHITAVPRGTYSPLPYGKGTTSSDYYVSNACGLGGIEYGINQIEKILGTQADYVVFVGFSEVLGILRTLKLPTTETLQWLRHRQGYAIGEPQRAHNHSTFLKQALLNYIPTNTTTLDTPLTYILYKMVDTDLSFNQSQQIIDAVTAMKLSETPQNIILQMKPFYATQDISYDPDTLNTYLHQMIDPIAPRLSTKDYAHMTVEEIQHTLLTTIEERKTDSEFITWAFEHNIWYQIEDEAIRHQIQYEMTEKYTAALDDLDRQQQILSEYVLEMEYLQQSEWAQRGKALLETE